MTRRTIASVAGATLLGYIAVAYPAGMLFGQASAGADIAARLANLAAHGPAVHLAAVLSLLGDFAAVVLAVSLLALTRDQDRDLALLGMACRLAEGVVGAVAIQRSMGLLWLATATGPAAPDAANARAIAAFLLSGQGWSPVIGATFFAVGSTCFSWLLLRGRMIPAALAWLGVVASSALVVALPLQLGGVLHGSITSIVWLPMAAYEIPLGVWLLVRGAGPAPTTPHPA